jgi:hypothetical protein
MFHAWGRREISIEFWSEYLKRRGHFEDVGLEGRIKLKWTLNK